MRRRGQRHRWTQPPSYPPVGNRGCRRGRESGGRDKEEWRGGVGEEDGLSTTTAGVIRLGPHTRRGERCGCGRSRRRGMGCGVARGHQDHLEGQAVAAAAEGGRGAAWRRPLPGAPPVGGRRRVWRDCRAASRPAPTVLLAAARGGKGSACSAPRLPARGGRPPLPLLPVPLMTYAATGGAAARRAATVRRPSLP